MYLVVHSLKEPQRLRDDHYVSNRAFWSAFDSEEEARKKYEELLQLEDLYTVSLCVCVKSTDYPCIKEVVWQ